MRKFQLRFRASGHFRVTAGHGWWKSGKMGLGNRNGHRKAAQAGVAQHGGKRVKNPQEEDQWVHPDAVEARKGLLVATKKRYGSDT